jgi:hypothetical protein
MFSAAFGHRSKALQYASLQAGLVSYWPMNDTVASVAVNQISSTTNLGFGASAPGVNASGKINGARSFLSSSSQRFYATASSNSNLVLLGSSNYTASFWFYPSGDASPSTTYGLISNDAFPTQRGLAFALPGSGSTAYYSVPHIYTAYTDGTVEVINPFSGIVASVAKNTWHFFCVRRDGNTLKFRLNGSTGTNITMTKTLFSDRSWFHVGIRYGSNASGSEFFNGSIDELALWNRTLSDTEVTTLYNSGIGLDLRL